MLSDRLFSRPILRTPLGDGRLRKEGDGHISVTAAYRYLGRRAMALVAIIDIGKGVLWSM
jgi:glycerol-3-phosphate acyltransferase PlsY